MRLEIKRVESVFDGASFGTAGPYEKIVGRVYGTVDPAHRLNLGIHNLNLAQRNPQGEVEYWVDFCVLKPVDIARGNRRLLVELPNRGDKLALIDINSARKGASSNDPVTVEDAGNGFLLREGYCILWSAWQGGVGEEDNKLQAGFPIASADGTSIVDTSREEIIFGHCTSPARSPLAYPAATLDQSAATLTVRIQERDARVPVPASAWRYQSPTQLEIDLIAGYPSGAIYEFIYPARDPIVMGLGFPAIRDVVSFLRASAFDASGQANPLNHDAGGPSIEQVIVYGRSQPGRFLREFVRLGFNESLSGGKVFDGILASIAGSRRIFLNQAFAQPGRFHRQHEDHLYPGDQFPFTYATRTDTYTGQTDGILACALASNTCPKIIHVDSSTEFWQGRSSLLVCDEHGQDIPLPAEVRLYLFASTQHAGPAMQGHAGIFSQNAQYAQNDVDYSPLNRALISALERWVSGRELPPASRFPRITEGTLVPPFPAALSGFPMIPGVHYPDRINELQVMDYTTQPPSAVAGKAYPVLVPKLDADGNEIAGIRLPAVAIPRATLTGWNLRDATFADGALLIVGARFPFAATRAERSANGDPRLSLEERYTSHAAYVAAVRAVAEQLCQARLLLAEDVARIVTQAENF